MNAKKDWLILLKIDAANMMILNPLIAGDADAGCKIHPEQTLKANTLAVIINIVT